MDLSQMAQHLPPGMKMPSEDHMKKAMEDVTHMSEALKPLPEDPNRTIPVNEVLLALATAPCMCRIIPADVPSKISELEEAMRAEKVDMDWVDKASGAARNHAIAMLWQINRQRAALKEKDADLDGPTAQHASVAVQLATKLLVQAQMYLPQYRWVHAILAVARTSALIANQLWSPDELEAQVLMAKILKNEGLRRPKLRLEAFCEPKEVMAGAQLRVKVALLRHHAGIDGDEPPPASSQDGIYEAYWLYVEGLKDEPKTPNSLLSAQPMVVKDLNAQTVEPSQPCGFTAPDKAGTYRLAVHVLSTSVTGVDLAFECSFDVVEDDVPALDGDDDPPPLR